MIALGLDSPEEFAEALYLAEVTATVLALNLPPRGNDWGSLDPETKAIKIAAAARLISLYRMESMTLYYNKDEEAWREVP
jgi:hypothetical protein